MLVELAAACCCSLAKQEMLWAPTCSPSIRVIDQEVWFKLFNGIFKCLCTWACTAFSRGVLCPSIPASSCSPVPGFGSRSFIPPLYFLPPFPPSYCFAASQGDTRQQRGLGKAGIFITLSYSEALKRLLQNKSPLRPFWSGVWLIASGIKKSLPFARRRAGTPAVMARELPHPGDLWGFCLQKHRHLNPSVCCRSWGAGAQGEAVSLCRYHQAADGEGYPRVRASLWEGGAEGCRDPCFP